MATMTTTVCRLEVRKVVVVARRDARHEEKVDPAPPRGGLAAPERFVVRGAAFAAARAKNAKLRRGRVHAPLARRDAAWVVEVAAARAAERAAEARAAAAAAALADFRGFACAAPIPAAAYAFTTGAPATTEVVVGAGLVAAPGRAATPLVPAASASSPLIVLGDERSLKFHGEAFAAGLERLGHVVKVLALAGDASLGAYAAAADAVLSAGIDKHSILFAVGGEAVCDVVGFVAGTLHRGIGLVHVPTTLGAAARAASSVGHGVGAGRAVGFDWAPLKVVVDADALAAGPTFAADAARLAPPGCDARDAASLVRAVVERHLPRA
jgi:hypothetical protein